MDHVVLLSHHLSQHRLASDPSDLETTAFTIALLAAGTLVAILVPIWRAATLHPIRRCAPNRKNPMSWLKQLLTRRRRYDELSESIREHLDEKIADLMDRGMTPEQAESTTRREFGNVTGIQEHSREVWQWPRLESVWAGVRLCSQELR